MYSLTKENLVKPYLRTNQQTTNQHQSGVTLWFHFLVSLSINNNRETDKSRPDGHGLNTAMASYKSEAVSILNSPTLKVKFTPHPWPLAAAQSFPHLWSWANTLYYPQPKTQTTHCYMCCVLHTCTLGSGQQQGGGFP